MEKVKYIKTKSNEIIVFPHFMDHTKFRKFEPISAGFISINADGKGSPTIKCYGESVGLELKSDIVIDSELARKQILGFPY